VGQGRSLKKGGVVTFKGGRRGKEITTATTKEQRVRTRENFKRWGGGGGGGGEGGILTDTWGESLSPQESNIRDKNKRNEFAEPHPEGGGRPEVEEGPMF